MCFSLCLCYAYRKTGVFLPHIRYVLWHGQAHISCMVRHASLMPCLQLPLPEISAMPLLQVVSQVQNATGQVVLLPDLLGVQGVAFETPTVVLALALGGMEDIPDGVVALLTRSSTDVLSHVAIRARTQGVLLAGCSDEEEWRHLVELQVWGGGGRQGKGHRRSSP